MEEVNHTQCLGNVGVFLMHNGNSSQYFVTLALCRFLIVFVILYMTQRSNFLSNRTIFL